MAFEFVNLYLSTILPPIILGVIIWKTDRFQEPGHLLLASFLIGFAIAFPLDLLIAITHDVIAPVLNLNLEIDGRITKVNFVIRLGVKMFLN